MPAVFTFNRTNNEVLQELLKVFGGTGTVREQWSMQAEYMVEPVGWDALWKLSKEFCKKFELRFPCIVYVTVNSVDFEALTASVDVLSVQHESVSLPESVDEIPLIELWPTVKQREQCINATITAEFIDLLRFFYTNLWMPWDEQDDKVLLPNTIEDRMQLWTELHNGTIPNCVARSILQLRNSAIDAHEKLKELDSSLCEDQIDEDDSMLPPNYITQCAEMTAKLEGIMSKWTLYEKSIIRDQYLAKVKNKWQKNKSKRNVVALWRGGSPTEFEDISKYLRDRLTSEHSLAVTMSADDALALEPEELIVCSDYELPEAPLSQIVVSSYQGATIKSSETRSCLLMLSETCELRSLRVDCALASTALVMRAGQLRLRRCRLLDRGDKQSDFAQGLVAMAGAKVLVEDCTFENFYTGIVVHKGAQVEIRNTVISGCGVGVQVAGGGRAVLRDVTVRGSAEASLRADVDKRTRGDKLEEIQILANCNIGSGDLEKEILIVEQDDVM